MATPKNPLEAFIWGDGGAALTPEEIARRREIEEALLAKGGVDTSPVGHWTQGLARVANAAAGSFRRGRIEDAAKENTKYNEDLINTLIGGSSSASSMPDASTSAVAQELVGTSPDAGGMDAYRNAIASIESAGSGDYGAVGPTNPKLGRALGRYQIMEANIGPWSQEALGRAVTPDEFLANPQLQDAIFDKKFGSYVQQYGPEGAAQAWFAGPGGVGKTGRRDVLGTSVGEYASKFRNALGPQVAAVTPQAAIEAIAPLTPVATEPLAPPAMAANQAANQPASFDERFNAPPVPLAMGAPEIYSEDTGVPPLEPPREISTLPVASPPQAAPQMQVAQQQAPALNQDIIRALSDPRANQNTRAIAQILLQQQFAREKAMQEQQTWMARQQFEQQQKANDPNYLLARDRFSFDQRQAGMTSDIKEYEYAKERGYQGSLVDFQLAQKKAGATNVTTNVGEGDKFYENLDKKNAETFASLSEGGLLARSKINQIDRLDALLSQSPQGYEAAVKQWLGDIGVNTEGLDALQSTRALLEKMVPEQRPPGSGPMSDADIVMFRNSLPRVINQPGGNQLILQTMRGIAQYEMEMGKIADMVADREIKPSEGRQRIRDLPNPLEDFNKRIKQFGTSSATDPNVIPSEIPGVTIRRKN